MPLLDEDTNMLLLVGKVIMHSLYKLIYNGRNKNKNNLEKFPVIDKTMNVF